MKVATIKYAQVFVSGIVVAWGSDGYPIDEYTGRFSDLAERILQNAREDIYLTVETCSVPVEISIKEFRRLAAFAV